MSLYTTLLNTIRIGANYIPLDILRKIPVRGTVTIHLPHNTRIKAYNNGDDYITTCLYWRGIKAFEPETVRLFMQIVPSCSTLIDIGANTGIFSVIAGIVNPHCAIYACEPVARICERLKKNLSVNNLTHATVCEIAITDYNGSVDLYIPQGDIPSEASLIPHAVKNFHTLSVEAITLDTFADKQQLRCIDIIKIDTEKTEHKILLKAEKVMMKFRPLILCEVLPGPAEKQLQDILTSRRYNCYWIRRSGLEKKISLKADPSERERNYLFVPKEKENSIIHNLTPA